MPQSLPDTHRFRLRELREDDAAFALALLNDPGFLDHIGDRGVRDLDQARAYLRDGPIASYARNGFGLWAVEMKNDGRLAGMCGLVRRDLLPGPDLGYAFLPPWRGQGLAREAARLCLDHAFGPLALPRVLAIVTLGNVASRRLLETLGMRLQGPRTLDGETLLVYEIDRPAAKESAVAG
ncbi:N-acetyltransferase [Arenimonas soli]|uniref:N-acetyltransferase n=1 Tax=Arenimonas soli TaxID=2269504 RepID=A0ABQ1HMY4_9GAMM|nr:GNAT family N-acetyltransferase [Arenimonas soli]GGA83781.1 N-acetyltransferase [Arenimonas soli]